MLCLCLWYFWLLSVCKADHRPGRWSKPWKCSCNRSYTASLDTCAVQCIIPERFRQKRDPRWGWSSLTHLSPHHYFHVSAWLYGWAYAYDVNAGYQVFEAGLATHFIASKFLDALKIDLLGLGSADSVDPARLESIFQHYQVQSNCKSSNSWIFLLARLFINHHHIPHTAQPGPIFNSWLDIIFKQRAQHLHCLANVIALVLAILQ